MNKKLLAAAISGALVAPMAAQAVDFKISGHIHRGLRWVDDGVASDLQHVDPSTSRSRFRFRGSEDIGNGLTAGIYMETGLASNVSSKVPIKAASPGAQDTAFDIRHSALFFSGSWGAVWMGHTSHASDGVLFAGFNASGVADTPTIPLTLASSVVFRTSAGGTAGTVGSAFASYDGARTDVLRYDSPKLGPAEIKVSVGNDQRWEAAAYLNGGLGGGKYQLQGGVVNTEGNASDSWTIAGAYLFSQGTNIAAGYGELDREGAGRTSEQIYFLLGHNWGNNGISISWSESQDHRAAGVDGTHWGIGFNHKIPKPGVEVYALYRNMELDGVAAAEDVDLFMVGTRIQFQ